MKRVLRLLGRMWSIALLMALVLGVIGHIVRDRALVLALMMYVPLLPLAGIAVMQEILARGRSIPRARFVLAGVAIIAAGMSALSLIGRERGAPPSDRDVTLLHWNVMWGQWGNLGAWDRIVSDIVRREPDIVVLSEAPTQGMIKTLIERLGPGWTFIGDGYHGGRDERYWHNLVVCSRWRVEMLEKRPIADGRAMLVKIHAPDGALVVLTVDGKSDPWLVRGPRLRDIAEKCESSDVPVDVIVGDFNTPGRSVGFDRLREEFVFGSSVGGWRGTWPTPCPVYDIDHVLVRNGRAVVSCELFTNFSIDHRGQVVRFGPAKPSPGPSPQAGEGSR